VQYLKNSKPSIWWRELKKLSGLSPAVGSSDKVSKSLQQIYGISDQLHGLANIVNETFLSPMRSLTPLPSDYWCNSGKERTYLHAEICGRLKAQADGFQLNETKCKELRFNFSSHPAQFEPIIINNKKIEVVRSAKVLGMKISSDLKWNAHIQDVCMRRSHHACTFFDNLNVLSYPQRIFSSLISPAYDLLWSTRVKYSTTGCHNTYTMT
jgi:hypothetical protein